MMICHFIYVLLFFILFFFFQILSLTISSKTQNMRLQRLQQKWVGPRLSSLCYNRRCRVHVVCECLETDVWGRGCIADPRAPRQRAAPGKWPLALLAPLALRSIIPYVLNGEANANDWWEGGKRGAQSKGMGEVRWGVAGEEMVQFKRRSKMAEEAKETKEQVGKSNKERDKGRRRRDEINKRRWRGGGGGGGGEEHMHSLGGHL